MPGIASGIGVLREGPLHASVKRWYALPGDREEIAVDGYVIDLVRDDVLIEIQTRGFSMMKSKVATLLAGGHRMRIVHPIALDRWIVNVDDDGSVLARRRSPRHGSLADLATELVSFPELLGHPGLEIEVLLIVEEEYRRLIPGRCWRRRGGLWSSGGWSTSSIRSWSHAPKTSRASCPPIYRSRLRPPTSRSASVDRSGSRSSSLTASPGSV